MISCWMILAANRISQFQFLSKSLLMKAFVFLSLWGCSSPEWVTLNGKTMGTTYTIKYLSPKNGVDPKQVQEKVDESLNSVNKLASTYQEDSEISLINKAPVELEILLSSDFEKMLRRLWRINAETQGYFDPTVGPLVNLYGFGPLGPKKIPTPEELQLAQSAAGIKNFEFKDDKPILLKKHQGAYLDFSASAKGYGVDKAVEVIEQFNIKQAMVEIGGEIRTLGDGPQAGGYWHLAIEEPSESGRSIHKVLKVKAVAMATSGDYRNYYTYKEKRFSHTIDPLQRKVIEHSLASVSVLGFETCEEADAWATALNAMGEVKALEFAESRQIPAYFIIRNGQNSAGFVVKSTTRWEELTKI